MYNTVALFESGEAKEPIDFELTTNENGDFEGKGEDNFYEYTISPSDTPCSGTLIVQNDKCI